MDGYQFLASIVQSIVPLAWPAALVACVWLVREKLNTLLPLLRMKYKDFDISFRLDQAEKEAAALPATPVDPGTQPTQEEKNRFEQIANISPKAAIAEVRGELEAALRSLMERRGLSASKGSLLSLIRMLRNKEIIDARTSALLDDLRVIGNEAVHAGRDTNFTKEDALRTRLLANEVIRRLEKM